MMMTVMSLFFLCLQGILYQPVGPVLTDLSVSSNKREDSSAREEESSSRLKEILENMIKNVTKQSCVATAEEEVWNMH